jgi:regulatory protein
LRLNASTLLFWEGLMPKITALSRGKRDKKRMNVFLDGKFAFSLAAELAASEGLRVGQELGGQQAAALTKAEQFQRGVTAAMRYLSYRPRSKAEMKDKLYRRGFDEDTTNRVILRLEGQGLIDDAAFACFWQENRQAFRPRSQWLIRTELRRKGVAETITEDATLNLNDAESAYRAAEGKAHHLASLGYQTFRRRLGDFLRRRGFSYGVINQTINRIWQEYGGGPCRSPDQ